MRLAAIAPRAISSTNIKTACPVLRKLAAAAFDEEEIGPIVYALVIMSIFATYAKDKLVEQGISEASARARLSLLKAAKYL